MPLAYLPPLPPSPTTIECVAISSITLPVPPKPAFVEFADVAGVGVGLAAPTVIRVLLPAAPYGQPPPPPKPSIQFHTDGQLFR